MHFKKY